MGKPRFPRTDDELRAASVRVYYCADQVIGLSDEMRRAQVGAPGMSRRVGNAVLESFVLQCRALLDFFDKADPRADDVVVADFFQSASWVAPPWSFAVDEYLAARVNKETAHITYPAPVDPSAERKAGRDRGEPWYYRAIATAFAERLEAFTSQAPQHLLHEVWQHPPGRPRSPDQA